MVRLFLQKKTRVARERDPKKRAVFQESIAQIDVSRLVFLDEAGFSLALYLHYGWGLAKERLVESIPLTRGKNLSVLGALGKDGMVASSKKIGAMKRVDVERFLEEELLPRVALGSVLVLDNARIHHGGKIAEMVAGAGCSLLYLSPYSPDFSPIELAWSSRTALPWQLDQAVGASIVSTRRGGAQRRGRACDNGLTKRVCGSLVCKMWIRAKLKGNAINRRHPENRRRLRALRGSDRFPRTYK